LTGCGISGSGEESLGTDWDSVSDKSPDIMWDGKRKKTEAKKKKP
jgi:hypothetical protein